MYVMHTVYEEQSVEAVLLLETSNALNSVSRHICLHNAALHKNVSH